MYFDKHKQNRNFKATFLQFCTRAGTGAIDDPDQLKAAFVSACTIADGSLIKLGSKDVNVKPNELDILLLNYLRQCKKGNYIIFTHFILC